MIKRRTNGLTAFMLIMFVALNSPNARAVDHDSIAQDDFNIVPNCPDDQTGGIQSYLDETARRGGGNVLLRPGYYTIKGSLNIPTGVTLAGSWSVPHHGIISKGTLLHAYGGRGVDTGPALLEMQQSSGVKGLTILYPQQELTDVQPYPWTIHGRGMHNTIENVTLVNSYQGICIGPESNELHLIRNVFGCVLRRGIMIDSCTDIGRIENVHFNPHYWPRSGADTVPKNAQPNPDISVAIYMQRHLEAFTFARTDWEYVTNTFVFGAKIGYRFIANKKGGACNGQFLGIGADMCQYCVRADKVQPWGILISNGEFVAGQLYNKDQAFDRVGIMTTPTFNGALQLSNCSFWGFFTNVIRLNGDGFVSLCQATINNHTPDQPAIVINAGRTSVSQIFFNCKGPHVQVAKTVRKTNVINNFAPGGLRIINNAGNRLTATNNE